VLERYFADLDKFTGLKDSGKTKIVSNLQKLQKKLTVIQIIKRYINNAVLIGMSRIMEFRIENFLVEFDRRDQNELIEKKASKKMTYNQYFNPPQRKIWLEIDISDMSIVILHGAVSLFDL
jgi:hypothetical protein